MAEPQAHDLRRGRRPGLARRGRRDRHDPDRSRVTGRSSRSSSSPSRSSAPEHPTRTARDRRRRADPRPGCRPATGTPAARPTSAASAATGRSARTACATPRSASSARRASPRAPRRPAAAARRTAGCGPGNAGAHHDGPDRRSTPWCGCDPGHRWSRQPSGRPCWRCAPRAVRDPGPRLRRRRGRLRRRRRHLAAGRQRRRLLAAADQRRSPTSRSVHIGFNMLALWVLGPQLELAIGRVRFLALYLLSGLAGSALVYWAGLAVPGDPRRLRRDLRPDGRPAGAVASRCAANLQRDPGLDRPQRRLHLRVRLTSPGRATSAASSAAPCRRGHRLRPALPAYAWQSVGLARDHARRCSPRSSSAPPPSPDPSLSVAQVAATRQFWRAQIEPARRTSLPKVLHSCGHTCGELHACSSPQSYPQCAKPPARPGGRTGGRRRTRRDGWAALRPPEVPGQRRCGHRK